MDATDLNLKLGLPGTDSTEASAQTKCNKRTLADTVDDGMSASSNSKAVDVGDDQGDRDAAPASKAQVVGWPPIRSYRRNTLQLPKKKEGDHHHHAAGIYVKVSMDGAPYLRKIDLKVYNCYPELLKALGDMFRCFTLGADFSERSSHEGCCNINGSDHHYVPTYEDKDGDWMLVGDVPWNMFISSCKRLRVMKGSEAGGQLGS